MIKNKNPMTGKNSIKCIQENSWGKHLENNPKIKKKFLDKSPENPSRII